MKPTLVKSTRWVLFIAVIALTVSLVSWDFKQSPLQVKYDRTDTVPKTKSTEREKKIRDLDDVLDELNAVDMEKELEKAKAEMKEAMKSFDKDKIKFELDKAMQEIDVEKMKKELEKELSNVNLQEIKLEMEKAMKEAQESLAKIDTKKIQEEINQSLKSINFDKLKEELEQVKKINLDQFDKQMEELKVQMDKIGPEIKESLESAKKEIEKAKAEMKEYKSFVDGLDQDGIISKKEEYEIVYKNNELTINGKPATKEVYSKYSNFLSKHKSFTIKKSADDFNIDLD
ncbi:MAG: hypothetical protein IPP93_12020 [Chitinophagaceae bacterium]|nr:hypothetical protein [Chitinophagaceae bacterium]